MSRAQAQLEMIARKANVAMAANDALHDSRDRMKEALESAEIELRETRAQNIALLKVCAHAREHYSAMQVMMNGDDQTETDHFNATISAELLHAALKALDESRNQPT